MDKLQPFLAAIVLATCVGAAGGIALFAAEYYTCGHKNCLIRF